MSDQPQPALRALLLDVDQWEGIHSVRLYKEGMKWRGVEIAFSKDRSAAIGAAADKLRSLANQLDKMNSYWTVTVEEDSTP